MPDPHPEFDVVITQMRSLEALYLSETPDRPIVAKDLLTICEAIRTLAEKMSVSREAPIASMVSEAGANDLQALHDGHDRIPSAG